MPDTVTYHHRDLSVDQQLALRTAATRLGREFDGTRYENWDLDDPAGQSVEAVRPIRDEIERRVRTLLDQLDVPAAR